MSRDAELSARTAVGLVVGGGLLVTASIALSAVLGVALHRVGRADLVLEPGVLAVYAVAVTSSGAVGVALLHRRRHPVGGAFVVLAAALAASVAANFYARYGALATNGRVPAADVVAQLLDPSFLLFFVSVAVALHRTPTGRPLTPVWGRVERLTILVAGIAYLGGVVSTEPIDPPFDGLSNPLGAPALSDAATLLRNLGAALTAVGLLLAVASLVVRFRRASERDRRQLLWLVLAAVPMPIFVAVVFIYRNSDNGLPQLLATGGFIVVVPVATALCITRFHLFEVDRILSRTLTYLLCTALVVLTYVGVVVASGRLLSDGAGSSQLSAVLGTLVAVTVAAPARRRLQDLLDRRFNRRRYTALSVVQRHLAQTDRVLDVDAVLREALDDPTLRVAYRIDDEARWVTREGHVIEPSAGAVVAVRGGQPVAAVTADPDRASAELVEQVVARVLAELDNTRLQAAIRLRLVEAEQSRHRIAAAELAERRRIERDLHDGAQQRLLALGFELRAAQLNGTTPCLQEAVGRGIEQTSAALEELRDLANGLRPAVLTDGGLTAALDDLATRSPQPLVVSCSALRFDADVEAAAWFVISEAVNNALKHAAPSEVTVDVSTNDGWLVAVVADEGPGGALVNGTGIQGMRDRAAAAGGSLDVHSPIGAGTRVEARLPCVR